MAIGKFGKYLTFQVFYRPEADGNARIKYLTFDDLKREVKNRSTDHARILKKEKVQFDGPSLSTMSFTMCFSSALGVNPREMLRKLETCVRLGKIGYFIVGTKKIGKHRYMITSLSESWDHVLRDGKLVSAKVDVTMKEYL